MRRWFLCILLFALCLTGCSNRSATDQASAPEVSTTFSFLSAPLPPEGSSGSVSGWVYIMEGDITYSCYFNEDGSPHTGWLDWDGERYYLDDNGVVQTGWLKLEDGQYYLQEDGTMVRGELPINGRSHFFTATGAEIAVVNPWNSLHENYSWDLIEAENGYMVDRSCAESLQQMLSACRADGYDAQIVSAYRSHDTQVYLFNQKVNYYLELGYTEADARKEAATVVAYPGTSEHELGLAVDLVDNSYWGLDEAQEHTDAQQWLMAHSWEYGFILRYPNDKSQYTGIIYEPWHYRYVGPDVAKAVYESGLCLEEYLNTLS